MEKETSFSRFFNPLKSFMFFLGLAFLTMTPLYADSGSEGDTVDVTDKIRMHMETVGLSDREIDQKLTQLKNKLSTGMSLKNSCIHCHADVLRQSGKQ